MNDFRLNHLESRLIRTQTAASNHREHASSIFMTSNSSAPLLTDIRSRRLAE